MMSVRKVSSHFEYLKNRSSGLDTTWQPVRGDLAAHWLSHTTMGQSSVRHCWVSIYTVWTSHSQISSLSTAIVALKKPKVAGSQIWAVGGLIDLGDTSFAKKTCKTADVEGWGLGRHIATMKLPSPLAHSYGRLLLTASLGQRRTLM